MPLMVTPNGNQTEPRRVKFNTISTEEQILRDKNRNVFLIDSFTATLYIFGRVPLSFIVHFYLVKVKVPDSIGSFKNFKKSD